MNIILASKSKARKVLLEQCGFRVKAIIPKIKEECKIRYSYSYTVKINALRKIREVAEKVSEGVMVAADTLYLAKIE